MKVTINGEVFDYDGTRAPMSEALAIEKAYGRRYVEWQAELQAGSAEALCVLAWIIWRRDGRNVELKDMLSGAVDFDLNEMLLSMFEAAEEAQKASAEEGPTIPGEQPGRAGTPTTGTVMSASSPNGSASARGRSASSKSVTSKL